MKYTRSIVTVTMTLFFMLVGAFFQNMGQRLGWCQEQVLNSEQQACVDSGVDIETCLKQSKSTQPPSDAEKSNPGNKSGKAPSGKSSTTPHRGKLELHKGE